MTAIHMKFASIFCRMCKILIYELTYVIGSPIMVAIPDPSLMQQYLSTHGVSQHSLSFRQVDLIPKKCSLEDHNLYQFEDPTLSPI